MNNSDRDDDTSEEAGGALAAITDLISDSTLPAPIKRNFFKAFGQLCTAAVEIPVAHLEGIATEKRAETEARVRLIKKGSQEIAAQMQFDPDYARAAVKKFGQRIIRERVNLDRVTKLAADQIAESQQETDIPASDNQKEISDDWLNTFEKEASQKSTADMQSMFAKVLAGEIRRPETFSIKSVKLLGEMDANTAKLFVRLCSLSLALVIKTPADEHIVDVRVASLSGNASTNSLQKYGLGFSQLNVLHEYGLIIPDYNSWFDYRLCVADANKRIAAPFTYQGKLWGLVPTEGSQAAQQVRISGVALSKTGQELWRIVEPIGPNDYTADLSAYFERRKLSMVAITKESKTQ